MTPQGSGSCKAVFTGANGQSATLSVKVALPGGVVLTPATLKFTKIGPSYARTVSATQSYFAGSFSESDDCSGVASVAIASNGNGSAQYSVTPTGIGSTGTCTMRVTGANGQSAALPITVTVGRVIVTPNALTFTALGAAQAQTVTLSQRNFSGSFTLSSDCTGVAKLKAGAGNTFVVTPKVGGACTATFTGAEGRTGTLAIAVNVPGQVLVSPSTLSFSNTGAGDSQSVTVTQTGNSAAFKADASSCRSKGVATVQAGSYAGGSQSFQITPTAVGSCLVTFTGSGGQQGTLAITVLPRTRVGPFSFTYSYGAGGELQEEQFVMAADAQVGTTSMSYAYTPAGRLLQHSETAPGGAAMVSKDTYDGYGRLQNQNFPDGNGLGQMEYDPAGELLGQVMSMSKGGPYTQTWTYDSLGELVASDPGTAGLYGASVSYYADGVQVFSTSRALRMTGAPSGISATWDARMGAAISSSYEYGEVVGKNTTSLVTAQTAASYDAVGRSLASTSQSVTMNSPTSIPSGSTVTRTYDVENHLVSADGVGFPKAPPAGDTPVPHSIYTTYAWGVNGHPIRIGTGPDNATGTTGFDTLIWDGGAPLYTMRHGASADTLDDVKLGAAGELTPTDPGYSGLTFYDRGHDGGVLFAHNVTGAQLLEAGNPWAIPLTVCASWPIPPAGYSAPHNLPLNVQWTAYSGAMCPGPTVPTIGNGATIGMLRTDGISDGVSTIQGTRAYDPTTSQWTTPDAFAGAVDDPGSQKSYMWNNNNPVAYADPSGYEGSCYGCQGLPFPTAPQTTRNSDLYLEVEGSAGFGPVSVNGSITVTTAPGLFVGGGVSGPFNKPAKSIGKVGLGGSTTAGIVTARPGRSTSGVMRGKSQGYALGYDLGVEHFSNRDGQANGIGAMTPQAGLMGSYGVQLLGGPGTSPPGDKNGAAQQPAKPRQTP